jgi:hypothetical protein
VNGPQDLETRIQIRQDLNAAGLADAFRSLRNEENSDDTFADIIKYLDIYETMTANDSSEYEKLKPDGIDVKYVLYVFVLLTYYSDLGELFTLVKLKFQNDVYGDTLLNLLQHLLLIPEGNFG